MQASSDRWVLLVDDHDDGRELLSELLSLRGLSVESCASGEEALVRVAERGAPSVVITDLTLGHMSGTDLAKRLREKSATASTPILAVTGHVEFDDPERLFSAVFSKPVRLDALTAAVDEALLAADAGDAHRAAGSPPVDGGSAA
jgi:CheY-like chemotaxis protein